MISKTQRLALSNEALDRIYEEAETTVAGHPNFSKCKEIILWYREYRMDFHDIFSRFEPKIPVKSYWIDEKRMKEIVSEYTKGLEPADALTVELDIRRLAPQGDGIVKNYDELFDHVNRLYMKKHS